MRLSILSNIQQLKIQQQCILRKRKSHSKSHSKGLQLPQLSSNSKIRTNQNLLLHDRKSIARSLANERYENIFEALIVFSRHIFRCTPKSAYALGYAPCNNMISKLKQHPKTATDDQQAKQTIRISFFNLKRPKA